ncbi:MAG TPA: RsfA family transcriptional regulator [Bacillaceae bacterium]
MTAARQDAWTPDEDLLLAEVVLTHIREGSTQLKAFEEAGKRLARTAAACGFRWNSSVRKQYISGIELAKKQRKEKMKRKDRKQETAPVSDKAKERNVENRSDELRLDDVILFLQKLDRTMKTEGSRAMEQEALEKELAGTKLEADKISIAYEKLKEDYELLIQEHRALLSIFEKARKLSAFEEV